MTPPPSELRAEELFQLSQTSLAAISGSGSTDPDPPVTPLVLEGILASTNIPVSILIDSGASLDAVFHNFAREHGLTMLPLKQSSATVMLAGLPTSYRAPPAEAGVAGDWLRSARPHAV